MKLSVFHYEFDFWEQLAFFFIIIIINFIMFSCLVSLVFSSLICPFLYFLS